jgi:DNA-binding NarL/FixJ family response regulator
VLERHSSAQACAVKQRPRQILELVLQGNTECAIAIDLRLAASTVSHELKQALISLGLGPRLSAVPLPIAQLYHAAASNLMLESYPALEPESLIVVLPRPEQGLGLAPTELLVCQMMLAGNTHAEIAATRRRSTRTIANQLASIFAKLRVSGRMELLSFLASRQGELPAAAAPSSPS